MVFFSGRDVFFFNMVIKILVFFFFYFNHSSLQGVEMKMSTSSVLSTSSVIWKDVIPITDRIINIANEGL